MKKAEVLFLAIGGLEASRLEQTEFRAVKRRTPKVLLVAAIVALTLLLVGCAVVIYNKIHLKYIQYEVPKQKWPRLKKRLLPTSLRTAIRSSSRQDM